ncbi:quinone oxidoreductase family protein [Ekhidna sp. To15]|uniref:quinone oxidoreductase family protein n=1 Tax=Ekhidna sp. To15 TaxID=3395267 RepID=UPI003F521039
MQAVTITQESEPIQLTSLTKPEISGDECLIKLKAAALNRRDQWIRKGMYPGIKPGTVLGSDGCGIVENGPNEWVGKEVIINPNVDWGDNPEVQSDQYSVLGMPTNGTLAEHIKVPAHRLHEKPSHLTDEEAAALPLAGLTAFRATIKKGASKAGKRVLVTGAGGGVSQFAIAFAVFSGAEVYVTSGSDEKIEKVKKMGVKEGFNYRDEKWFKSAADVGGFDSIIDSAGGNQLNNYLKVIKPAGRIVMYGSTTGHPEKLDVFRLFWSQAQIMGSTMGSDQEFVEMVEYVNKNQIKPTVDKVFELSNYLQAFDRFMDPDSFGKIVIRF